MLEWIVGAKTWLVTVHCERILFWAAAAALCCSFIAMWDGREVGSSWIRQIYI